MPAHARWKGRARRVTSSPAAYCVRPPPSRRMRCPRATTSAPRRLRHRAPARAVGPRRDDAPTTTPTRPRAHAPTRPRAHAGARVSRPPFIVLKRLSSSPTRVVSTSKRSGSADTPATRRLCASPTGTPCFRACSTSLAPAFSRPWWRSPRAWYRCAASPRWGTEIFCSSTTPPCATSRAWLQYATGCWPTCPQPRAVESQRVPDQCMGKLKGCRSSHCKRRIQRLRGGSWAAWDSRSIALGVELQRIPARVNDIGAGFRAAGSETSCTQTEGAVFVREAEQGLLRVPGKGTRRRTLRVESFIHSVCSRPQVHRMRRAHPSAGGSVRRAWVRPS